MTDDVVTVRPDTSFREIVSLLMERRVSGVPVVDETGTVVG
ncbi:MAG TPA: CBS domain-containing protein, partial [Actinomycetota bacterium]|nr:CBS domain-containing protein [Actinomycetota bacterium]